MNCKYSLPYRDDNVQLYPQQSDGKASRPLWYKGGWCRAGEFSQRLFAIAIKYRLIYLYYISFCKLIKLIILTLFYHDLITLKN